MHSRELAPPSGHNDNQSDDDYDDDDELERSEFSCNSYEIKLI